MWHGWDEKSAGAPEFIADGVTLGMDGRQYARMQNGTADESDTLGRAHDESTQQAMRKIIRNAWLSVTGSEHHDVTNIIINRAVLGAFTSPFNQLRTQVQSMAAPIATARRGIVGLTVPQRLATITA